MRKELIIIAVASLFVLVLAVAYFQPGFRAAVFRPLAQKTTSTTLAPLAERPNKPTFADQESGIPSGRIIVLTIDEATDVSGFQGKLLDEHAFIGQYGQDAAGTLKNYPVILNRIRKVKPDFLARQVGKSFANQVGWLEKSEREFLLLAGSAPGDPSAIISVIAYEPKSGKAYVLRENSTKTKVTIYGDPDRSVLALLTHYYLRGL
ncbi:MAG: hypothetical protein JW782_00285 [Candidatus Saganbacteria bacterium]|nr:hypothetical protein [Candidatus Saganbacteria bacterium]